MVHDLADGPDENEMTLKRRLGDAWDPDNPVGYAAVLAADEARQPVAAGEQILDEYGLNAEFVPKAHGGRLGGFDRMIRVMRVVSRRDAALGFGYCGSSFIASTNVWTSGDGAQQRTVADHLLAGGRIATAYHELDHGNDIMHAEFTARATPGGFRLTGRKEVIANAHRAGFLVLFARTGAPLSPRGFSQILVEMSAVPAEGLKRLPRFHSVGMHGVNLGGVEFNDFPVPASSVLGRVGHGLYTAMRSFQITRIALPAIACASLDTGLRTAVDFATRRRLSDRPVTAYPAARRVLAESFIDLLMCDALATVAARALHLLPAETSICAAAVKYLVPRRLSRAMQRLSRVLGAGFYVRDGRHGIFQKHMRDMAIVVFGHLAPNASLAILSSQLRTLAGRPWAADGLPDDRLFRLSDDLPEAAYDRLAITAKNHDTLVSSIMPAVADVTRDAAAQRLLGDLPAELGAEVKAVHGACVRLDPSRLGPGADPAAFDLAARYAALVCAAALLHVHRVARDGGDAFLGDPAWLRAGLNRLLRGALDDEDTSMAWAEIQTRYEGGQTFDLACDGG